MILPSSQGIVRRPCLVPMLPLSIVFGGMEIQFAKTLEALQKNGLEASVLEYSSRSANFDLLHLFGSSPNFLELAEQVASRWPIIISAVSSAPSVSFLRKGVWEGVSKFARVAHLNTDFSRMKRIYQLVDAVICLNELEAEFVSVTYGVPPRKVRIITNGVDDLYFSADPKWFTEKYKVENFVLFTGNIVARKNPVLLAHAVRKLGVPAVFIGNLFPAEADYGRVFEDLVRATPQITWIQGSRPGDPLLASAYAAADLFCLPSEAETQSLSALEAMAAGTAVMLADRPYAYQFPFKECRKCQTDSIDSVAASISEALTSRNRDSKLSEEFRWQFVAKRIQEVYASL